MTASTKVLLGLGIQVIALLLSDLVNLVDSLVTGRASLSIKTKLLQLYRKKIYISKNSMTGQYEIGNRFVSWRRIL